MFFILFFANGKLDFGLTLGLCNLSHVIVIRISSVKPAAIMNMFFL